MRSVVSRTAMDNRKTAGTINLTHPDNYVPPPSRRTRTEALLGLLPSGESVLEIGAREGYTSLCLREKFSRVVALDLEKLPWEIDGITFVKGDIRALEFPAETFDCVVCAEVLEHIDDVAKAASELSRVTKRGGVLVVSVPYKEDRRIGRMLCPECKKINPRYGHLHSFDAERLRGLFPGCEVERTLLHGSVQERTTSLTARMMELAGLPFGSYGQHEPCIFCGGKLLRPVSRPLVQRMLSKAAATIDSILASAAGSQPEWIYLRLRKS